MVNMKMYWENDGVAAPSIVFAVLRDNFYPTILFVPVDHLTLLNFSDYSNATSISFSWDIFRGGLQPELRKVGWRILLSVFPLDTTGQERIALLETKTRQYLAMKQTWKRAYVQGQLSERQLATLASVSIDVVRTDWSKYTIHPPLQLFPIQS